MIKLLKNIREIVYNSYFHLLVVFIISIFLYKINIIKSYQIQFVYFALILGVFGLALFKSKKKIKIPVVLLYVALILIIVLRIIPFFGNSVPLGYDPGLYKNIFENPVSNDWSLAAVPLLFSLVFYVLNLVFGSQFLLTFGIVILSSLVGYIIYYVLSKKFNKNVGIIAILIYLVSIAQFQTFWWNYIKNICGLGLLILSYLYFEDNKRINWKLILVGGLIAGVHRPAFLIFGLSYFIYVLLDIKNFNKLSFRNSVINGLLIIVLALLFNIDRIGSYLLSGVIMTANSVVSGGGGGTFFNLAAYFYYAIPFIPFAITGFVKFFKKNVPLALGALVSSLIVLLNLVFYNRFIIYWDIFVIIYAALGFYYLMKNKKLYGQIIFYGFILLFFVLIMIHSLNAKPLISESEFEEIKSYDSILPANSLVIVTNSAYSPWIKGYVHRDIIAPGLFSNNPWNYSEWLQFWSNNSARLNMLHSANFSAYKHVYLHQGNRQRHMNLSAFTKVDDVELYEVE